jgi:GNAT superfamily N-acetyltransferase
MTEVEVRRAEPDDAERLAAVYRSAYAQNEALGFPAKAGSATAETVRGWIEEDRLYAATVDPESQEDEEVQGDDGGRIIVGGVRLKRTDPDRKQLSRLGVHADWKGQGIGGRLLDHAEAVARDENCDALWLTTPPEHPFLPDLYRARGYEKTGEWPLEYRDYDEIVMEKRLAG